VPVHGPLMQFLRQTEPESTAQLKTRDRSRGRDRPCGFVYLNADSDLQVRNRVRGATQMLPHELGAKDVAPNGVWTMDNTKLDNTKLHEFVTNAAVRNQITFGDVRRLQRDYLPGGVSTCEEAELLIHLDRTVARADRAWADWLVNAILDFAVSNEPPIAGLEGDVRERLKAVLASAGTSTKATRRIAREIRRETRDDVSGEIRGDVGSGWLQAKDEHILAQAASLVAVRSAVNALPMAA
jgi:hypothetical protein